MLVGVIGSGSWGVALAQVLVDNKVDTIVWGRSNDEVVNINENHKLRYFDDVTLSEDLKATNDFNDLKDCDVLVLATPSKALDDVLNLINNTMEKEVVLINVSKGFHAETSERLSVAIERIMRPEIFKGQVSLIGPTHAEEVIVRLETVIAAVSNDDELAKLVQKLFANEYFRVYTSDDVISAEIGAAVKNVIAVASGILSAIGLGDNARAALITRGLAEISRLGMAMGGKLETFYGLTGMGDLIVTATSKHSRNYQAGLTIGSKGAEYFWEHNTKTVEGVSAVVEIMKLSKKYNVEMPICEQVYNVLYNNISATDGISTLMSRELRSEH